MIESALQTYLESDTTLVNLLAEYNSTPAIFAEEAPEDATFPYLIYRITQGSDRDSMITTFSIFITIYDTDKSRLVCQSIASRVKILLHRKELTHSRYSNIRIFFYSGGPIIEADPRDITYNLQFMARGSYKQWMIQL